jgi:hypothetical protein
VGEYIGEVISFKDAERKSYIFDKINVYYQFNLGTPEKGYEEKVKITNL